MGEIDFPDLIARSKKIEENVLIDAVFGKVKVKPMYRRFRAVLPRDVTPGTTGGQDIQDAVEHRTMVGSGSPDMRFLGREMRLNDCPEFVIDFPECHTPRVLFKVSYNCGMTSDVRGFTRNGWDAKVYYTYMLPTDRDVSEHISKNARRSIRKAQKLGVTATEHFDAETYWELTKNTFAKQNSQPPFSKKHLMNMLDAIREKNLGEMWVAKTPSGEVAAAEVIVCDSKTAHRWSAASAEEHLNTGAASLLLSEVVTHFAERHYPSVNLMAGNMARLSAFIATFNPDLVPYYGVERSGPDTPS
nr:GNAT family N-acetyltransferase [Methanoculleus sp. UBA208]